MAIPVPPCASSLEGPATAALHLRDKLDEVPIGISEQRIAISVPGIMWRLPLDGARRHQFGVDGIDIIAPQDQ